MNFCKELLLFMNLLPKKKYIAIRIPIVISNIRNVHTKEASTYCARTHTCGEITRENINQLVTICGWLHFQRMNQFVIVRDAYGSVQAFFPPERRDFRCVLKNTPLESVVKITGKVQERPQNQINKKMSTGEVEVFVEDFKVINSASKPLPFTIRDYNKANELTRMKYRYLDLRFPLMQRILRFRSAMLMKMREFLLKHAFVEVETPTLFKKTPGGAQEFIVPTHFPGKFYSLVQSPQQLKQLLMVGGVDRYFQLARCYRDEGARPDRQPEFTQLDIEMSFSDSNGVMSLIEDLLCYCWPEDCGTLNRPFQRIKYKDALETYGTDQPALISEFPIISLNDLERHNSAKAIIIPHNTEYITSDFRKQCQDVKNKYYSDTNLYIFKYVDKEQLKLTSDKCRLDIEFSKLKERDIKEDDFIFLTVGPKINALKLLGKVRSMYISILRETDLNEKWSTDFTRPIWIVDFPLFETGEQSCSLKSVHHPFTCPHPEDLHLLQDHPLKVRGLHYDLVLNGYEIGGGSVRIHDPVLQTYVMTEILKLSTEELNYLIEALASGAPPHAGIALGVDRLIAILVGAQSIRDVIAFPKTVEGRDCLSGAPSHVLQSDLELYKIKVAHAHDTGDSSRSICDSGAN